MKKLLILGANPETIPLIQTAQSMGIYTIVTDFNPDAPAKKFADKGININGMDVNSLVDFCKREGVDGVLVGVADRLIEPYQEVCEKLNLPCYGDYYQCKMLTNKGNFNELCREYDLNHIPSVKFGKSDSVNKLNNIVYPVFIKPIDRNSGKGMSIAYDKQELEIGIKKAFDTTSSSYVLLERYMIQKLCNDVLLSYTITNGEPILSAMGDRYTTDKQETTSQVCKGAIYPSDLLSVYMIKEHQKIVKMLKGIGLKNAILTISAFVENGEFYYYDPGFRLQGEAPNLHMEKINGFDQKEFLINIALGNEIKVTPTDANFNGKFTSTIWVLLKEGVIGKIEGFNEISKDFHIFHISKRLNEGDLIDDAMIGTESQVLARIYINCNSAAELYEKIIEVQNKIKVFDINGNDQILDRFKL